MRFEIFHEIKYRYSGPVFFEPHTFFLRPREDTHHRLIRFEMKIDPEPSLLWTAPDLFGNDPSKACFQSVWDFMTIRVESEVEVAHPNPFDFILEESCLQLPVHYRGETAKVLGPYLSHGGPVAASVKEFSDDIVAKTGASTGHFLTELCQTIYASFKKIHRADGAPWPGAVTLERREGACRDLAVLFMECCRAQGLAARFTSGYYCESDAENKAQELHAWPEVFLEGSGWRAFDPTVGLTCGEFHIPIASADEPGRVLPVHGQFRGNVASSMETQVQITGPLISSL